MNNCSYNRERLAAAAWGELNINDMALTKLNLLRKIDFSYPIGTEHWYNNRQYYERSFEEQRERWIEDVRALAQSTVLTKLKLH